MQMTKEAVLAEAQKLLVDQRHELVSRIEASIAEDTDDWEVTEEDKALIDQRDAEMEAHPEQMLTYEELKAQVHELSRS